jgi:arginyl-tRNA synthetase
MLACPYDWLPTCPAVRYRFTLQDAYSLLDFDCHQSGRNTMNLLNEIRSRFAQPISELLKDVDDAPSIESVLSMIRPAQDPKFGDYQANCAMPLQKRLGKPPREIAAEIVAALDVDELCETPEVAGPGFINLRIKDEVLVQALESAAKSDRLGVAKVDALKTIVVDFSSPNVAKPMHVGHIRSTVIGDSICRTLRFLGHHVISDNHLGDWGTQFGMVIYGYKHFADADKYVEAPVAELSRLYKLVNQLIGYHSAKAKVPELQEQIKTDQARLEELAAQPLDADKKVAKKQRSQQKGLGKTLEEHGESLKDLNESIKAVETNPERLASAQRHTGIAQAVLQETVLLHSGDEENGRLWNEFLPHCREEIQKIYDRLDISFDHELGESFYHDQLGGVVEEMISKGFATESEGATCIFLDGFEAPMIIRKKDGAFLYATTDLATIKHRADQWAADEILYVVDKRQSDHFEKLFTAARRWGIDQVKFAHISFGTVLGPDGKPIKTRSGESVALEELLDEAVRRAGTVVETADADGKLSTKERKLVANVVGHGAVKYNDLSHNRESDYKFDFDKMLDLKGDTAAYMQYAYARVRNIFLKEEIDTTPYRETPKLQISNDHERSIAITILRFSETLDEVVVDYRPNHLTDYLYTLANDFSKFYAQPENHVLKAATPELRDSRLVLCDLVGRTIQAGMRLVGINVAERM